jgi:DNA polymerase
MKKKHRMADIRGSFMDYRGRDMMVTYHPAALLRNPNLKKPVWEDVKKLRQKYDDYMKSK